MFILSWFFLFALLLFSWHLSDDPNRVEGFWATFVLIIGAPIGAFLMTAEAFLTAIDS